MAAFTDLRKSSVVAGSVHGTNDYLRWVGRSTEERAEQRKAARLCLDTSAHAGSEFQQLVSVLSCVSHNSISSNCTLSSRPGSHITQKAYPQTQCESASSSCRQTSRA